MNISRMSFRVPSRRTVVWVLLGLGAALVVTWILFPDPTAVDTATATLSPLEATIREDGRTRIRDRYVVDAPVTGRIGRIDLRAGDPVQTGDTLTHAAPVASPLLDPRSRAQAEARVASARAAVGHARAAVDLAETAAAQAREELRRQETLLETTSGTPYAVRAAERGLQAREEEVRAAQFRVRMAETELQAARAAVGAGVEGGTASLALLSPIEGRVLRVLDRGGGMVGAGTPLLELGDPAQLEVVVDVLTEDAVEITPGCAVRLTGWGGDTLSGRVRRVEPSAYTRRSALGVEEQRLDVIVDLVSPPSTWASLGDGYRVDVTIVLGQRANALSLPIGSFVEEEGAWHVFLVKDGRAVWTPVRTGVWGERRVEVLDGVREGDQAVVYPPGELASGARVASRTP